MQDNYIVTHLHTMYGNGGFIDSVVKPEEYINKAKELNMQAIAFTEHGNVFSWYKKKKLCEDAGLKYIHGIEVYVTETLNEKIRDNYHCCLYARNFEGFKEINKLSSLSFKRQQENRYYYNPRITFDELINTSDNVIISTACLGGILSKGHEDIQNQFLDFIIANKHRCFLEVQPHIAPKQCEYNKYLLDLSNKHKLNLIAATDTHCLEETESRSVLQRSKNINFEEEDEWDLTFKSYNELVEAFGNQGVLSKDVYLQAIENTNVLGSMVEEFPIDHSHKYPKIYENPEQILLDRIEEGLKFRKLDKAEYQDRINYEFETYKANGAIQYILLEDKVKKFCRDNNIHYGYSRGSCSGSVITYLLQITDINSVKWETSFERFMSKERISLADLDSDIEPSKRHIVKEYLFNDLGVNCCDIITHNTIALKGAIRDCGRALDIPLDEIGIICEDVESSEKQEIKYRQKYPKLFEYVDKLLGCVVSVGSHPCGSVVSDYNLEENMATFTTSTSEFPISQINMKEIDAQNYVKLDLLSLDTVELIAKTCELADIPWITTDSINFEDENVWDSIHKSSCMIFQFESPFAHQIYKKIFQPEILKKIKEQSPQTTNIDLFSMANGAIRPAGESYREDLCKGIFKDNGHEALNNLLSKTLGYLIYQESILEFLNQFCGFTKGEADIVRRNFAKKTGTEKDLPKIHDGFIKTMNERYGEDTERYEVLIKDFLKVIEDASNYLFSLNHSHPYSMLGYVCAWLRYYYPLEFICSALNIYVGKEEKTSEIVDYAKMAKIKILPIKYGKSKSEYFLDKSANAIYKGIGSIKFLNNAVADELYELSKNKKYNSFTDLLFDIQNTSTNSRQLDILIKLNFFSEFGNIRELLRIVEICEFFKFGSAKSINKAKLQDGFLLDIVKKYSNDKTKAGKEAKSYTLLDCNAILKECEDKIKSLGLEDLDIKLQLQSQVDWLGYISATGKEEDRATLMVKDVYPLYRKKDNKQFGYSVITQSIGSGIQSRFTIFNKVYTTCGEIKKNDLIRCLKFRTENGYFTLENYKQIF